MQRFKSTPHAHYLRLEHANALHISMLQLYYPDEGAIAETLTRSICAEIKER